jgi:hypothetical protein
MNLNKPLTDVLTTLVEQILPPPPVPPQKDPKRDKKNSPPRPEPKPTADLPNAPQKSNADAGSSGSSLGLLSAGAIKKLSGAVAEVVTDQLMEQIDRKIGESIERAEQAVARQRSIAMREVQDAFAAERGKMVQDLHQIASSISTRLMMSAMFIGGSLLVVAVALFAQK